MVITFAMWLPVLGTVAVLVLTGWKVGRWPPLGVAAGTVLLVALARRWPRPPGELSADPAAGQRWRDGRVSMVGRWLGTMTVLWLGVSVVLLILIVVAALLRGNDTARGLHAERDSGQRIEIRRLSERFCRVST